MKKIIIPICTILFLLLLCACNYQDEISTLPIEKMYIVECNWGKDEADEEDYKLAFKVIGFSELDKNFNFHTALRFAGGNYYTINIPISDSVKNKISKVILKYLFDTTFLYQGHDRIYDGNSYIFIFQKNDGNYAKIYFEPKFLPDDLMFLYNCLYNDKRQYVWKNEYKELFTKFEEITMSGIQNGFSPPPPPILKGTIQFTPPNELFARKSDNTKKISNNILTIPDSYIINQKIDSILSEFIEEVNNNNCYFEMFVAKKDTDFSIISLCASQYFRNDEVHSIDAINAFISKHTPTYYQRRDSVNLFIYSGIENILQYNNPEKSFKENNKRSTHCWTIVFEKEKIDVYKGVELLYPFQKDIPDFSKFKKIVFVAP
jgi:hypothetical protein